MSKAAPVDAMVEVDLAHPTSTRDRIVSAAREALVDVGYPGTTISQIATRAGIAEGTIFRHFPTKAAVLATTCAAILVDVRHTVANRFLAALEQDGPPASDGDAVDRAIAITWSQYGRLDLVAVHEVFAVSRTDVDLAHLLEELNTPHRAALYDLARVALPEHMGARPDFELIVDFVIDGVASIGTGSTRDADTQAGKLAALRSAVHALVAGEPIDRLAGAAIAAAAAGPRTPTSNPSTDSEGHRP